MSNQNRNNQTDTFVNLITTGLGYINRPRWIDSKSGSYLAVSIAAFHGKNGEDRTFFEVNAKGNTIDIISDLMEAYPNLENVTVTCGFVIGGGKVKPFQKKDGSWAASIQGQLVRLSWIKVNGEYFYREQPTDNQQQGQQNTGNGQAPEQHHNGNRRAGQQYDDYQYGNGSSDYYDDQPEPNPYPNQNGNRQAQQRSGYANGNPGRQQVNRGKGQGHRPSRY